jgi:inosine-uridine nucleoside N-ribohydrolase
LRHGGSKDFDPMARKIILDVDPGIDDAVAVCLALEDPSFDVLAVTATGGTVSPEQSTTNVQAIVEQLDPPRWPRLGCASADQMLRADGRHLFGVDGMCGAHFAVAKRHHQHSSVKVICDEVRAAPGDVTIVATGPLTNIASALQQQPDLASLIGHLIMIGGTLGGPGNVTAAAEFNIYCDAEAARAVFHSAVTKTLIPIDLSSRMILNFDLLEKLPNGDSRRGELLRRILPGAFRAYRQQLGVEGIHLHDAVAIVAALEPELFTTERMYGDIETEGTLTYGATVFDRRRHPESRPNMDVVVDMDTAAVTNRIVSRLTKAA